MRGRTRQVKSQLREKGYQLVREGKQGDQGYQLVIQDASGKEVTVTATTRAKAWRRVRMPGTGAKKA